MEGLMGGRGEPNYRVKTDALYIDGNWIELTQKISFT